MLDHSFTLQAIMDLKDSVSTLTAKTDRLITDVEKQGEKIGSLRDDLKFMKGAAWVIGVLVAALWSAGLFFAGKYFFK